MERVSRDADRLLRYQRIIGPSRHFAFVTGAGAKHLLGSAEG